MSDYNVNTPENLWDEQLEGYDPSAEDSFQKTPEGTYNMTLSPGQFEPSVRKSKAGNAYVQVHVQGIISQPGSPFDGRKCTGFISSMVFDSGTSLLTTMLKRCGLTAPRGATLGQLRDLANQALNGGNTIPVKLRWEAKQKLSTGTTIYIRGTKVTTKDTSDYSYTYLRDNQGNLLPEIEFTDKTGAVDVTETIDAFETIAGFPEQRNEAQIAA